MGARIEGSMTALVTPFTKDGEVDWQKYRSLIDRQIKGGINWIVPMGTTGESSTLSHQEHMEAIKIAVEMCRHTHTHVLAGTGSNSTREAVELSLFAKRAGAHGVLLVTPYYNKPTQRGLYLHFRAVAEAVNPLPVVLYDIPGRSCVQLEVDTIEKLVKETDNIRGLKEATGKIDRVVELRRRVPELAVLSGDDALNFQILASGGKGVISVVSNLFPRKVTEMVDYCLHGDWKRGLELHTDLYPWSKILFIETNPIPVKYVMAKMGLLELKYRLPLCEPSPENQKILDRFVKAQFCEK